MGKKDFIQIVLKPKNLSQKIDRYKNRTKTEYRQLLNKMANSTVQTMKAFAPSRTGRLRASIRIKVKRTNLGKIDLRANVIIGPTVPYSTYVDLGTASSSGRFVPFLGRKLVTEQPGFGRHPGIRARHFIDRTKEVIDSKFNVEGENFVRSMKVRMDRL